MAVKRNVLRLSTFRDFVSRDFLKDHKDGGTLRVKLLGLPVLFIRRRVRVQLCWAKKIVIV
jgi:hypothetical protein